MRACALCVGLLAGSGPAASNFLLLRQKKVTKEKATLVAASPALRSGATCGARFRRGLAKLATLRFAQTTRSLIRLNLRSSAHPQGAIGSGDKDKKTKTNTNKESPWRVLVGICLLYFGIRLPIPIAPCGCAEERRFRRIRDRVV